MIQSLNVVSPTIQNCFFQIHKYEIRENSGWIKVKNSQVKSWVKQSDVCDIKARQEIPSVIATSVFTLLKIFFVNN